MIDQVRWGVTPHPTYFRLFWVQLELPVSKNVKNMCTPDVLVPSTFLLQQKSITHTKKKVTHFLGHINILKSLKEEFICFQLLG